ncbi:hypothetical protein [Arthrobacter sp. Bi83]
MRQPGRQRLCPADSSGRGLTVTWTR